MMNKLILFFGLLILVISCNKKAIPAKAAAAEQPWIQLFNGKDMTGWTPKIRGFDYGDNFANTFRVEDGILKVSYDGYESFDERFGHLFYKESFSSYRLRVEYRFVGEQLHDGPGWAFRNNGLMLHCQDPKTMLKDQDFPVSIEAQILGGNGKDERSTCNLCTPGTHVEMDGNLNLREAHAIADNVEKAIEKAYPDAEVLVHQDPAGLEDPTDLQRQI